MVPPKDEPQRAHGPARVLELRRDGLTIGGQPAEVSIGPNESAEECQHGAPGWE